MTKRVYKFVSAKYGICDLEKKHLKIANTNELNDPFDLAPVNVANEAIEYAVNHTVAGLRGETGLLCFSANWSNILMWSHYADGHQGVCLGFDIPHEEPGKEVLREVRYQSNTLELKGVEDLTEEFLRDTLTTKYECWSYEQELRAFVKLTDPPDEKGFYWLDFGPHLELKEVIIGAVCPKLDGERISRIIGDRYPGVLCDYAYMRNDVFALVRHNFPPKWFENSEKDAGPQTK